MAHLKRLSTLGLTMGILIQSAGVSWAADSDAFEFFKEEAKVVTASRREQSISEIPMAVDVVTPQEIRASGATTLWDLLRFRVGMDVLEGRSNADPNRAAVSVRGFPQEYAANLLVLVDGRSVYSARSDSTFFEQLPVPMQDIERIEIIRGPNAALYGTGASLGVINFITKKPQGDASLEADNRGGTLGMAQSYTGIGSHIGKMAYRASYLYHKQNGFPLAGSGEKVNDFLNKQTANFRGDVPLSADTGLELFTGATWSDTGIPATGNPRSSLDTHFERFKVSHQFSPRSTIEISADANDTLEETSPSANGSTQARDLQYDVDILHRLDAWDKRVNTTYGVSYRNTRSESVQQFGGDHAPLVEYYRGYLQEMVKPVDRLTLQGAASLESTNVNGLQPSYQAAALFAVARDQAFRVSYSVAHTVHDLFPLFADSKLAPTVRSLGNPALIPYKVTSYETGYRGEFQDRHLVFDTSLYYTEINNFHIALPQSITFNPFLVTLAFQNYDDSIARGVENQIKYHFSESRWVYANYTYENITDRVGDLGLRSKNTPAHKLNVGGAADLGRGFSGSIDMGYKDHYFIASETRQTSLAVPAYWRLDARLAYVLPWYKEAEFYIAGQNLLESNHEEFPDGLSVPRTYQGGLSLKFGGTQ